MVTTWFSEAIILYTLFGFRLASQEVFCGSPEKFWIVYGDKLFALISEP